MSESSSRWGNCALNVALLVLGAGAATLLYALVSQGLGTASPPPSSSAGSSPNAGAASPPPSSSDEAPASTGAKNEEGKPRRDTRTSARRDIIQVGVRNGCGEPGLAARTRDFLVRAGFDVVEVGNYSSFDVDSSMVIDRAGDLAAARRVARALGIPARRVRQDLQPEYYLDASVVLGEDYSTLTPFRRDAAPAVP